jgi:hypothetical protein
MVNDFSKETAYFCPFCGKKLDVNGMYSGDFVECEEHGMFIMEWRKHRGMEEAIKRSSKK